MRVISGTAKGLQLNAVLGDTTRPILDRVKTPLFDIISPHITDTTIALDAFAGAGSLGIEALSRGAAHCIFLDTAKNAIETINQNLTHTKLIDKAEVRWTDAFKYLRDVQKSFDLIFIDPPQNKGIWLETLKQIVERPKLLNAGCVLAIKIHPGESEKFECGVLDELCCRRYGESMIVVMKKEIENTQT